MAVTEEQNLLLEDLKSAIISELITYEFYSRSSVSVKIISGMHAFEEMMLEEETHVKMLKEEYKRLGRNEEINYDPHEHGGIALPKLNVDATVALDLAMTDELSSIKMYSDYIKKYKGTETVSLYEKLLNDEMKHLGYWDEIYKNITGKSFVPNEPGKPVYTFTKDDLEVIETALKAEKAAYDFYNNAIGKTEIIDGSHAFQHMAWEEKIHVEKLEDEYFRLVNEKPQIANQDKGHTTNIEKDDDALVALELSIKEEKASLRRYLELEERCTNTRLREVIWELIESEWSHIKQWRDIHKNIREKNLPLYASHY
jgi:rubrerythrin